MINLGLILGGSRVVKVLNSCLVAETAFSDMRGTVSAIYNQLEQLSEILYHVTFLFL